MRSRILLGLLAVAPALAGAAGPGPGGGDEAGALRIDRGEGAPPLYVPRHEKLVYGVRVGLGFADLRAGTVTLEAGVEPYRSSLLFDTSAPEEGAETAWLRSTAVGEYGLFHMDSTMETRHLPVDWPRISMLRTQQKDVEHRRELKLGILDGKPMGQDRHDTDKNAPPGTRVWKKPKLMAVPAGSVDLLTSIYLARTLVREHLDELVFPLVDKEYVWKMTLRRGETRREETPSGTFDVVEVCLDPEPHPDQPADVRAEQKEKFEGLFGLKGAIHLWVDAATGIPIRVQGDLPISFLELHIDAVLEEHEGTPPGFGSS